MPKKQNTVTKGLRIVKDTFVAYGQRLPSLLLFSLVFFGTITFTITYTADALFDFISNIANNPTLSDVDALPVEQIFALLAVLMFVLPLAMGGLLLLSPPGQDIMSEGNLGPRRFHPVNATMTYLRSQYKNVFVSNITFFILLFFFHTLLQYILALFFMRSDAELLTQVTGILFIIAEVFILPLFGLLVSVCLFEKIMGLSAVRRAISMARANLGLYGLVCLITALVTLGSPYLFDWAMATYVMTGADKIWQFAVSAIWQALIMPLSYISMLLFYRRTLSLHDVNVLFPN